MKTKKILSSILLISIICGLLVFNFYSQTTNIINDSNIVESNVSITREENTNFSMSFSKKIGRRYAPAPKTYSDIEFAGIMVSNNTGLSEYNSKPGIKSFPNIASVKSYDSEKVTYEFTVSMISQAKYEYKTISYNLYDYTSDTKGALLTSGYIKQGIGTIELEPSVAYFTEKTYIEVSIDEIAERHLVTFLNGDQEIFKQYYYEEQPIIYPSSNPYKQADDEYEYKFAGWDSNQTVGGTSDLVISAVYTTTPVKYNNISLNLYSWTDEAYWDHTFTNGIEVSLNKEKVKAKGDTVDFTLSLTDEAKGFYDSLSVEISYEDDDTYTLDTFDAEEGTTTLSIPYCDYDVVVNVSAHFNKNDSHVFEVGNMYNLSKNSHYDTAPGLTFTSDKWAVKAGDTVTVTMTIADEYKAVYKDVMYYFNGQYGHFAQGENTFTIPSGYSSSIISVDPRIEREGLYTYTNLGLDMEDSFFVNVYEDADKKDSTPYANISFELGSILALADIKSLKIYEAGTNKEVEVTKNGDVYSYVMPACDIVFDVEFDTKEIEIEYDLDGGECEGLPTSITYHKKSENYMVPREVPYKEGYDFSRWYVYNQSNGDTSYFFAWGQADEIVIYDGNYKFNTWLLYLIDKNTTKIKMTALWSDAAHSITINYNQEGLEAETIKVGYKNSLASVLSSYIDKANSYCLNNNINAIFTNWSTSETDNVLLEQETMKYSNLSLYAFYEKRDYAVTYLVDGVVFKTETYRKGDTVVLPENPTKESDNTYSYVFTGWDNETSIVDNDLVFNALFDENYINYTVTFVVEGNVYDIKNNYHYGDTIILPLNPTKDEDNTYTYTFSNWNGLVENVDGNQTFEAIFNNIYKEYTVKFISNGNVLSSTTYHYNDEVVYPSNPESYKSDDLKYEYTFNKWDKNITNVESDVVINALFNEQLIDYTVTFDVDGNITSNIYHMGDDIIFPTNPTKDSTKVYSYEFSCWDNLETKVTGDMNFKALFNENYINYTVTFVVEGNVYDIKNDYHYGDTIVLPLNPTKDEDNTYTYAFSNWNGLVENVDGNQTFEAIFNNIYKEYTVKFISNGNVLSSTTYHYNDEVVYPSNPESYKSDDLKYEYTFNKWDKNITNVESDVVIIALFNEQLIDYTVTFDVDGNITSEVYHMGDDIIFPTNPIKASKKVYNYEFIGWDNPETKVTGDMNFKALFDKTFIKYTIKFLVDGNEYDVKTTYHYGDRITKPKNPTKLDDDMYGYTFEGWDKETEVVEDNVTFNALFKRKLLKRNVKWYDEDGTLLKSEDVTIGEVPTFDSIPQKRGNKKFTYEFAGWDKEITPVKEDASYVATYNSIRNKITVSFYDEDNNLIKSVDYQIGDDAPELDYQDYITKSYKEFNGWVTEDGISLNEKLSSDDLESEIKAMPTITIVVTSLVIPISITSISLLLILIIVLIAYIKTRRRSRQIKKELER